MHSYKVKSCIARAASIGKRAQYELLCSSYASSALPRAAVRHQAKDTLRQPCDKSQTARREFPPGGRTVYFIFVPSGLVSDQRAAFQKPCRLQNS